MQVSNKSWRAYIWSVLWYGFWWICPTCPSPVKTEWNWQSAHVRSYSLNVLVHFPLTGLLSHHFNNVKRGHSTQLKAKNTVNEYMAGKQLACIPDVDICPNVTKLALNTHWFLERVAWIAHTLLLNSLCVVLSTVYFTEQKNKTVILFGLLPLSAKIH